MRQGLVARVRAAGEDPAPLRDALWLGLVGGILRAAVAVWAATRFPPVEDARFYHQLATRLAEGQGYTWRWPDGAVTHVAHYPVGYPALLSSAYALFGAHPGVAMAVNALLGTLAVVAVHRVAASSVSRLGAGFAGLAAALHPALVLYTPALMTEGVTAALLVIAGWVAVVAVRARRPVAWWLLLGALMGLGALVRGQTLLIAPLFGAVAGWRSGPRAWRGALTGAGVVALAAAVVILPWTLRNCRKMDRCVVVSANVGWNLLIGATEGANGTFVPIEGPSVPERCRTVFGEAEKDACFAREAVLLVRERPLRWLGLVPRKLAHTFEYCGAAGWYLGASAPTVFSEENKLPLGAVETGYQRLLVLLGLVGAARASGPRPALRRVLAGLGVAALFAPFAWLAYVALVLTALLLGRALSERPAMGLGTAAIGMTLATHAVFFGAGRYSLVLFPLVAVLAGSGLAWGRGAREPRRFDIPRGAG